MYNKECKDYDQDKNEQLTPEDFFVNINRRNSQITKELFETDNYIRINEKVLNLISPSNNSYNCIYYYN